MARSERRLARELVEPGERVLAWAAAGPAQADTLVVATDRALYLPQGRLEWAAVLQATWEPPTLVVEARIGAGTPPRLWQVHFDTEGSLPAVIHERVRASILVSEHVVLDGGERGARFVARRDGDAARWTVTFDPGLDPFDPDLRERAEQALTDLRSILGI